MRLDGMADAFRQQLEQPGLNGLSFEERFGLLVDRQRDWKENRALMRRLVVESEWVKQHLNTAHRRYRPW